MFLLNYLCFCLDWEDNFTRDGVDAFQNVLLLLPRAPSFVNYSHFLDRTRELAQEEPMKQFDLGLLPINISMPVLFR